MLLWPPLPTPTPTAVVLFLALLLNSPDPMKVTRDAAGSAIRVVTSRLTVLSEERCQLGRAREGLALVLGEEGEEVEEEEAVVEDREKSKLIVVCRSER